MGFDLVAERERREQAGAGEQIQDWDLYPDVRPALANCAGAVWVGIAGNQTARAAELLRELELPVDDLATSGQWGWPSLRPASSRGWRTITTWQVSDWR